MPHQGVLFDNARATIFRVRDDRFYKFWVYIMASPAGTLCVGVTGYFDRRVGQHKSRAIEGFTREYACHLLVYYEIYDDAAKAIGRENSSRAGDARRKLP